MIGHLELNLRFAFHPADTDEKRIGHEAVRRNCMNLAQWLDANVPDSREKSLAITHLEEVMFWSNAAIARHL